MIKTKLLIGLFLAVFIAGSMSSYAVITNSKHDFKGAGWNTGGEICIVCHTPHNASTTAGAPLWHHKITTSTFTMYPSSNVTGQVDAEPNTATKLCLSCHDGVTALDAFGGATGTTPLTTTSYPGTKANLGTVLDNDHPISITYTNTGAGLNNSTNTQVTINGSTGPISTKMLINGKVECSSCHDVHNNTANSKMLLIANTGSALCLTCHIK